MSSSRSRLSRASPKRVVAFERCLAELSSHVAEWRALSKRVDADEFDVEHHRTFATIAARTISEERFSKYAADADVLVALAGFREASAESPEWFPDPMFAYRAKKFASATSGRRSGCKRPKIEAPRVAIEADSDDETPKNEDETPKSADEAPKFEDEVAFAFVRDEIEWPGEERESFESVESFDP